MKIGIVGFGYVGQALAGTIKEDVQVAIYDLGFGDLSNIKRLAGAKIIFIALPSPNTAQGEQDSSALEDFFQRYEEAFANTGAGEPIFVLKSTYLYEVVRPFIEKYKMVANPEFLNQNSAFEDCLKQEVALLGGRRDLTGEVESFYKERTRIECAFEHMSAQEAINFKYVRNIYGAYKVLFWNWVQEQTGNARKYADLYERMPQGEMSQIAPDGRPGFGGACFPKDLAAFDFQNPHMLTKFMMEYNSTLRGREFCENPESDNEGTLRESPGVINLKDAKRAKT